MVYILFLLWIIGWVIAANLIAKQIVKTSNKPPHDKDNKKG